MGHVFIVIPVHNRLELTNRCLLSIEHQDYKEKTIIVVDDGSTDETSSYIIEQFPRVKLLSGDGNLWWTGATNLGISLAMRKANPNDFVLLLNNDLIIKPNYLSSIVSIANQKPDTIIGSVEVHEEEPKIILSGGVRIDWLTAKHHVLNENERLTNFSKKHTESVSVLTGRGTLYPISVFHQVGLFDNRIIHRSDYELPRRAHLAGYELIVHYSSVVKTISNRRKDLTINHRKEILLYDIPEFFTGINSNFNLRDRWFFSQNAFRCRCRSVIYFIFDFLRIINYLLSRLSLFRT